MVIQRTDQRRRRVVIDEVSQQQEEQKTAARKSKSKQSNPKTKADTRVYSFSAHRRNQLKTTDLIPKRFLSSGLVVLGLLSVMAGLNFLASYTGLWGDVIGDAGKRSLSMTGVGTLSSWFSSFLLIMTGFASLQIYALRQHRCDDYRGTYRIWLWLALLFVVASIHCVADLGSVVANIIEAVTGQPVADKIWALVTFKMVALTMLVVRGMFEVRESRGSLAMVVIVWVAYSAATVLQVPALKNSMVLDYEMCYGNVILFATAMLMLAHVTYARFVYLKVHGFTKKRVAKKKIGVKNEAKTKTAAKTKTVAKPKTAAKPKSKKQPKRIGPTPARTKPAKETVIEQPVVAATKKRPSKRPPVPKPAKKVVPPVPKPSKLKANPIQTLQNPGQGDANSLSISSEEYAKMSKSERRRQRKLEKRARRAA